MPGNSWVIFKAIHRYLGFLGLSFAGSRSFSGSSCFLLYFFSFPALLVPCASSLEFSSWHSAVSLEKNNRLWDQTFTQKKIPTHKEWQDIQYSTLRRSRRTEATKQRVTGGLPSGGCNTSMALICCCLIIFTMTLFLFFWYICHPVLLITCAQGSESFGSDAFWMFWPELFRQNMLHLNNKFYGEAPEFLNPLNISF